MTDLTSSNTKYPFNVWVRSLFAVSLKNNSLFFQTTGAHFLCGSCLRRVQTWRKRDRVIRERTAHTLCYDMIGHVLSLDIPRSFSIPFLSLKDAVLNEVVISEFHVVGGGGALPASGQMVTGERSQRRRLSPVSSKWKTISCQKPSCMNTVVYVQSIIPIQTADLSLH